MAQVNDAYRHGDEEELGRLLQQWQASPESVQGDGVGSELVRTIRKLAQMRERLSDIDGAIKALQDSEVYELYSNCQTALEDGRNLLEEKAAELDQQIAETQRTFDAVSGVST